jgi:hypothetical protein
MILWAIFSPLAALALQGLRRSVVWFVAFSSCHPEMHAVHRDLEVARRSAWEGKAFTVAGPIVIIRAMLLAADLHR